MKKTLILFSLLFAVTTAIAQPKPIDHKDMEQKREKIEAIKAAYITEALDLSVAESQQFWPVYNELHKKELVLKMEQRYEMRKLDGNQSEKDVAALIYAMADTRIKLEELRKSYLDDFIAVLGATKTAKLMRAEMEFGRRIMEQIKRGERPGDSGNRPKAGGHQPMD